MSISLKFPDGNVKSFDDDATVLTVAQSISNPWQEGHRR